MTTAVINTNPYKSLDYFILVESLILPHRPTVMLECERATAKKRTCCGCGFTEWLQHLKHKKCVSEEDTQALSAPAAVYVSICFVTIQKQAQSLIRQAHPMAPPCNSSSHAAHSETRTPEPCYVTPGSWRAERSQVKLQ